MRRTNPVTGRRRIRWAEIREVNSTRYDHLGETTGGHRAGDSACEASVRQRVGRFETSYPLSASYDPHLYPVLLKAGYVQIGNPFFPNCDPSASQVQESKT